MEEGQDPDDYTIKLIEVRGQLHEMGEKISDERFEDILLQGLTDDYEFTKMTSFHSPNFGINEIQSIMRNLYIDRLSRPGHVNKLAGRGAAMTTAKRFKEGTMLQLPRIQTQQARLHKQQGEAICYTKMVLATQLYDTQRCRVQRSEREAQCGEPQGEVQSAHTATKSTVTEEVDDFGYAFVTSGWTPSVEYQETKLGNQPRKGRQVLTHPDSLRNP